MSGSPSKAIATLRGTSRTGRCHNAYFRQEQLKSLHDTLRTGTQSIISAIRHDTNNTDAEACIEVATALKIVKEHHESINPKEELEAEYRIAQGENALQRTEPIGVIYLENISGHTPFLAVVSPLSAALAAGNCIALKVKRLLTPPMCLADRTISSRTHYGRFRQYYAHCLFKLWTRTYSKSFRPHHPMTRLPNVWLFFKIFTKTNPRIHNMHIQRAELLQS